MMASVVAYSMSSHSYRFNADVVRLQARKWSRKLNLDMTEVAKGCLTAEKLFTNYIQDLRQRKYKSSASHNNKIIPAVTYVYKSG